MDQVSDITVEILRSIRDEIGELRKDFREEISQLRVEFRNEISQLRQDTNARFEQMDKRFEQMDKRFERMETDIRAIASHFERDYLTLANKVGELEGKFEAHLDSHS